MGTKLLLPAVTRGDVFALPEDDYLDYNLTVNFVTDEVPVADPTELPTTPVLVETTPESQPNLVPTTTSDGSEEPEELCSGKPFDAFTDLKNGSLYAFRGILGTFPRHVGQAAMLSRWAGVCSPSCCPLTSPLSPGKYFYELDKTSVRPGYPKLISDVWGIEGPIDAAFTRINCQGKTYLFKVGCRAGGTAQPPNPAYIPFLHLPCTYMHDTPNPCGCSGTLNNHSLTMGFPNIHLLLLTDLWLRDVAL